MNNLHGNFGKIRNLETRNKMSLIRIGRPHVKHTAETKLKISQSKKGKINKTRVMKNTIKTEFQTSKEICPSCNSNKAIRSKKCMECHTKSKLGSKSSNWKGGITQKEYSRNLRKSVLQALGGVCIACGFSDFRALQIDHINGGGSKERKLRSYKGNFHSHVLKSFLANENKYQLLCANCNWIKRHDKNEITML